MRELVMSTVKRIVIYLSSQVLLKEDHHIDSRMMERLALVVSKLSEQGKEVVIVTPGAVQVGARQLNVIDIPDNIPAQQVLAAVGQGILSGHYQRLFSYHGLNVGQVLLPHHLTDQDSDLKNVQVTLETLLLNQIVPIIQQNISLDTSNWNPASQEFDHHHFATLVSRWVQADLLLVMSQPDGLYMADPHLDPQAHKIDTVHKVTHSVKEMAKSIQATWPQAEMIQNLQTAEIILKQHQAMVLINGTDPLNLLSLFQGKDIGTLFIKKKDLPQP